MASPVQPAELGAFLREVDQLCNRAILCIGEGRDSRQFDTMGAQLEECLALLRSFIRRLSRRRAPHADRLAENLQVLDRRMSNLYSQVLHLETFWADRTRFSSPVLRTGHSGRPSFLISKDQLEMLSSFGFKWTDIAKTLGKKSTLSEFPIYICHMK